MKNFIFSIRNYTIDDIRRLITSKEIAIQPKFQRRRRSWPLTAKTWLIDSIINNFPIPVIYTREFYDESNQRVREIIDGQQRITTIIEFLNNEWVLSNNISDDSLVGATFSQLPLENQQRILSYELVIQALRDVTDPDVIAIFSRINSFSQPLNKQERRNAEFSGEFKQLVYSLSANYYIFWIKNKIFNDTQIGKMDEALFVSEVLTTFRYGLKLLSPIKVDQAYKSYTERYNEAEQDESNFHKLISCISALFQYPIIKERFSKQVFFFSLFFVLAEELFNVNVLEKQPEKNFDIDVISLKLTAFIENYNHDVDKNTGLKQLFTQGTGSTTSRVTRHQVLSKYLRT
ncbi:DUF262 domain-containing protein [Mucilaginibacter myungsuensis]|uniref:DUF262 domain-containing protein n=1 Tax=Mucilaginibacter myungsuensis TaxID=649104 RepID=A0A929KUL2_9SPHI|nr:DUF262 domain-containing protein [Mucilaginibacter myungsuensis]MBE9660730.1 DUF262 domain-containing protein [Mucilaginibacter myungsuensis]MDN3600775.1 DUF262 domain-containing protein [Mucilaginibacter myungsuensis]